MGFGGVVVEVGGAVGGEKGGDVSMLCLYGTEEGRGGKRSGATNRDSSGRDMAAAGGEGQRFVVEAEGYLASWMLSWRALLCGLPKRNVVYVFLARRGLILSTSVGAEKLSTFFLPPLLQRHPRSLFSSIIPTRNPFLLTYKTTTTMRPPSTPKCGSSL